MNIRSRVLLLVVIALAIVGCDQFTKSIAQADLQEGIVHSFVGDTIRVQLAHNPGAFLSLGASLSPQLRQAIWTVGVGVVLFLLLGYLLFARTMDRSLLIALALILSGGASNLYDRIVYDGYVVDFLNVGVGWLRTGIFNVADMAITGAALMILYTAFRSGKAKTI
ncbi:MAG TPA: signal peptidase II [Steroidobacteraceae bacterium]|nr:signal peptidase II [Steroidobacteraceae bacterium]